MLKRIKLKPLNEERNVSAQFNLGVYYNFGIRIKTDKLQAKRWYEIAVKGRHAGAVKKLSAK